VGDCFSTNDISALRRPKNVKLGRKMESSTRIMHALRFLEKNFSIAAEFAKKCQKGQKF